MNPEFLAYIKGCNLWTLKAMLKILQNRLGTIQERPNDVERAQAIAHQINNMTVGPRVEPLPVELSELKPKRFTGRAEKRSFLQSDPVVQRTF